MIRSNALDPTSPVVFGDGLWYRNTPSTFCDAFAAYNLSSGVRLGW